MRVSAMPYKQKAIFSWSENRKLNCTARRKQYLPFLSGIFTLGARRLRASTRWSGRRDFRRAAHAAALRNDGTGKVFSRRAVKPAEKFYTFPACLAIPCVINSLCNTACALRAISPWDYLVLYIDVLISTTTCKELVGRKSETPSDA